MSSGQRLPLMIDVFQQTSQRAMALPELTPTQLIEAILQEFKELEYLSNSPAGYQLLKATDRTPLDDQRELQQQLSASDRQLILAEKQPPTFPDGAKTPSMNIYLREQISGRVYKLNWLPALIGRPDKNQPHNDWVAVDLSLFPTGLRVSRRQASITEAQGHFFIESLSGNPTLIKSEAGEQKPVGKEKQRLQHGDIIYLERSNISLKFIVRPA